MKVRFGLVTDIHYADKPSAIGRNFRGARERLRAVVAAFNAASLDFVVELGDLIDSAETVAGEEALLRTIGAEYAGFRGPRHYVLGNHCVWSLTKSQFYTVSGARPAPYAFAHGPLRFVVLDACYRADGVAYGARNNDWRDAFLPLEQLDLVLVGADRRADRSPTTRRARRSRPTTGKPIIVFVHHRLDVEPPYGVANAAAVRAKLEAAGTVLAVFQGHEHAGASAEINGIPYITLPAVSDGAGGVVVTASAAGIESMVTVTNRLAGVEWGG